MLPPQGHSKIEIARINGKSTLITSKVYKPLKIFTLYRENNCQVVFSNYGGGFVEGDQVLLDIHCEADTKVLFSSQANTRIYKSENNLSCRQEIHGSVGENGFVVFLGDPVVPHQGSIFEQLFRWKIKTGAVLLLVDWFEAGRLLNDERFMFQSFTTDLRVEKDGIPLVWDKFEIRPSEVNVNSPGAFLDHSCYLNVFLIGNKALPKVQELEAHLRSLSRKYFHEENPLHLSQAEMMGVATQVNDEVYLVRCSAKTHEAIRPLVKELTEILAEKTLLGFNPAERKF
jgi:urease accessory protein